MYLFQQGQKYLLSTVKHGNVVGKNMTTEEFRFAVGLDNLILRKNKKGAQTKRTFPPQNM